MKKILYTMLVLAFFACKDEKKTNETEKKEVTVSKEVINEEEK